MNPDIPDDENLDYTYHYRRWHNDTEEHAAQQVARLERLFGAMLPPSGQGAALDIGCGMGFALRFLSKRGYSEVVGIDTDRKQVELCLRKGLNAMHVTDSGEFLQNRKSSYSLVLMLDVLEHIPKALQVAIMKGVFLSLEPGGTLILSIPNATSPVGFHWLHQDYTHVISFSVISISFLLENCGFSDIVIDSSDPALAISAAFKPSKLLSMIRNSGARKTAKLALVRWLWRNILEAELPTYSNVPLGRNLHVVCRRP